MVSIYVRGVVVLALLQGIVVGRAMAQNEPLRPVSREEGMALARFTLQRWPQIRDKPDCSHLVHAVYREAGLDYEYAPTEDLFAGISSFALVQKPQPGDLVVWHGHAGIVIDPEDGSFYSSVVSGFSVSKFDSSYWRSRGPRRFYRYNISDGQSARLLEAGMFSRLAAATGEPAPIGSSGPKSLADETGSEDDSVMLVNQMHTAKPAAGDVRSAFIKLSNLHAQALLRTGPGDTRVEIVDSFDPGEIGGDNNLWRVEVKIKTVATMIDGEMSPIHGAKKLRLSLALKDGQWTLLDPAHHVFLLRPDAIAVITERLARLSHRAKTTQLKPLSKALEMLLADGES